MTVLHLLLKTKKFTVVEKEFPSGKSVLINHPGAVVILPFVDDDHVCLITNHRKAIDQKLFELPAGTLEPDEPPLQTAIRELAEETGYTARSIEPLLEYFVSPGIMNEKMYVFVARDLQTGEQNLMDDEEIETLVVPFDDVLKWIQTGKIQDAKTIATVLYYKQFKAIN